MERLSRAQESRDLGESHDGPGDVDWLRASGMVAQRHALAISLWRLIENRDKQALQAVFAGMIELAQDMGMNSSPAFTVSHVLTWMLDPVCKPCSGRGYDVVPGTPTLSAQACAHCESTGQSTPKWGENEKALHERLAQMQNEAAAAIARKMRG